MQLAPVVAEITSYAPRCECCGTTNITANGTNTDHVPYNLAADSSLPFGSVVYIPAGNGVLDGARPFQRAFVVDDRGGLVDAEAKRKHVLRLDLRVRDCEWARRFGRKRIVVYVVK